MNIFEHLEPRYALHGSLYDLQVAGASRDDVVECLLHGCPLVTATPLPHQDNPEQQAEHLYLFSLFPVSEADGTSRILIPLGATMTVAECISAEWIRVQGTLNVLPGASIRVDTIVTDPGSMLDVSGGTVTFIDGPLRADDPLQMSRGLIAHGTVNIHGDPVPFDENNLTRSVVFESENPLGTRGHVMFMHNAPRVHIEYAAFNDLGRTDASRVVTDPSIDGSGGDNPRGRYSVHFHRGGSDAGPAVARGVVVVGAKKLGIVNHSSNVLVDQSIVDGFDGSGFFTETGNERGAFTNNLARNTTRIGGAASQESQLTDRRAAQDFGHSGVGFWLQGPGVTLDGNEARNVNTGVMMLTEPLKENGVPVSLDGIPISRLPVTINNQLVVNAGFGVVLNHLGTVEPPIGGNHKITDSEFINVGQATSFSYTSGVDVVNVRAVGNIAHPTGIAFAGNGVEDLIRYTNVEARGFVVGFRPPYINGGTGGDYELLIEDSTLACIVGIAVLSPNRPLATPIRTVIENVTYEPLPLASLTGTGYYDWPQSLPAGQQFDIWQEVYP